MEEQELRRTIVKGLAVTIGQKFKHERLVGKVTKVQKVAFEVEIPELGDGYTVRILFSTGAARYGYFNVILGAPPAINAPADVGGKNEAATGEGRWSLAELVNGP